MQTIMRYRFQDAVMVIVEDGAGYWHWKVKRGAYKAEHITVFHGHWSRRSAMRAARRSLELSTGLESKARDWKPDRLDLDKKAS